VAPVTWLGEKPPNSDGNFAAVPLSIQWMRNELSMFSDRQGIKEKFPVLRYCRNAKLVVTSINVLSIQRHDETGWSKRRKFQK